MDLVILKIMISKYSNLEHYKLSMDLRHAINQIDVKQCHSSIKTLQGSKKIRSL